MAKILIVDDEVTIIELLEDCLNEAGHQVTAAHDITEAIRALNAERFDLAIIDARMRGRVEGLDVCRLIKGNPRTARTRVLIVSGLPEMETLAFLEGADAFMAKPFPPRRPARPPVGAGRWRSSPRPCRTEPRPSPLKSGAEPLLASSARHHLYCLDSRRGILMVRKRS